MAGMYALLKSMGLRGVGLFSRRFACVQKVCGQHAFTGHNLYGGGKDRRGWDACMACTGACAAGLHACMDAWLRSVCMCI
eukprot:351081-Chlamydomonas_euryale.AAC.1